ncbi:hypothetical protein J2X68_004348 [Streptomyces sp. 3330]|nr:hypothetical protein [Streptomyces sp. 3330]
MANDLFITLRSKRNAVAAGHDAHSPEYMQASNSYAEALQTLRSEIRRDLGRGPLRRRVEY